MLVYKSQGGFYKAFNVSFSGCKRLCMYVCPLEHLSDKVPQKLARRTKRHQHLMLQANVQWCACLLH